MKKIKQIRFQKWKIVKMSGAYYINTFVEKSPIILIQDTKFFKIKKDKLRKMGMRFPNSAANDSQGCVKKDASHIS